MTPEAATPVLTESRWGALDLTVDEARLLQAHGRSLAKNSAAIDTDGQDKRPSSVISVRRRLDGPFEVYVSDCIGAFGIGNRTVAVQPKVPLAHLLYLLQRGGTLPRRLPQKIGLERDLHFFELMAMWLSEAASSVIRRGLLRDYEPVSQELPAQRGTLAASAFSRNYYSGRLLFPCTFEEYSLDTPHNRVLAGGIDAALRVTRLPPGLRNTLRQSRQELGEATDLRRSDLDVQVDRRTHYYGDALQLSVALLRGVGRGLTEGPSSAWSFLIRTPEPVERAVRSLLSQRMAVTASQPLVAGAIPFAPDLDFAPVSAIGDVKYKIDTGTWERPDLYQLTAFVKAHERAGGILINFSDASKVNIRTATVGSAELYCVSWPLGLLPEAAGSALAGEVAALLVRLPATS